ncbi:hypothetical protein PsYK624_035440 [Phanerochaete sordida]|uniref:F-box domain-containing protein n=1 Tax=Phanerochaete sordida TaxID=48140 RepID=A0A9P3L9N4_9APHY|nr:hypothetical protein PsYK624_035440 [Phanerochaete sordida]
MAARFQQLPLELIHHVLENLDKASLAVCTLASRNFMELARPHRFRRVIWTFSRLTSYTPGVPGQYQHHLPEHFPLLADFLESQPKVASYVRHIQLSFIEWDVMPSHFEVFLRILRHLPRLLTLTLDGIPGDNPKYVVPDPRKMVDLPLVPRVQALRLKRFNTRRPVGTSHILCLFGSIDHLIITDGYDNPPHEAESSALDIPYPMPRLLELHNHSSFAFVDLLPWLQPHQIHRLKLLLPRSNGLLAMQELVQKVGAALQQVHFSLVQVGRYPSYLVRKNILVHNITRGSLDISSATSLESIVLPLLICHVVPSEPQGPAARTTTLIHGAIYSFVVAILATAAQSLRAVTVELSVELVEGGWERRRATLFKPAPVKELSQLRELEEVCSRMALQIFEVRASPGGRLSEDEKQKLREALPGLLERGVLRFS